MAESHLVTVWLIGLGADEDRDVLTVFADEIAKRGVLLLRRFHAIGNE